MSVEPKIAGKHENNPNSLRNRLLIAAGLVVIAVGAVAAVKYLPTFLENRAAQTEPAPIIPRLDSANWQIMTPAEIKAHAEAPQVDSDILHGKIIETAGAPISPTLQEKAKAAGYTITYQKDPNDTTGRTILTTDRETDTTNNPVNDGFGEYKTSTTQVRGIFKKWVPSPKDTQQQNEVYALLENPLTTENYLVGINFGTLDSLHYTYFIVEDLNYGPADVGKMHGATGSGLGIKGLPDIPGGPYKSWRDFPTFNDLFKGNVTLDDIMQPGDYVLAFGGSSTKDKVSPSSKIIVRRFGGMTEWKAEAGIK